MQKLTILNSKPFFVIIISLILISSSTTFSQDPVKYFKQNCLSCHTIGGGRLTGPDLKNLEERKDRAWLVKWLMDPQGILQSGDPYAIKLQKESKGAVMTLSPGMNTELANSLLVLIETESKLEKSQFAGLEISDRPFIEEDIILGRNLFVGRVALENGGPACISCHNINGLDELLGGGQLGLNLTKTYATLGGRKALSAWLSAPPSLTMIPIFTDKPLTEDEILALTAYLKDVTEKDQPESTANLVNFLLLGIGGAAILLVLFDFLWGFRLRSVRKKVVADSKI